MALRSYQEEVLAVAKRRNVMLNAPVQVGKTYMAAMLLREWILSLNGNESTAIGIAVATTAADRLILFKELARLCSTPVWMGTSMKEPLLTSHLMVISPDRLLEAVRSEELELANVSMLVMENTEQIHCSFPSFFRYLFSTSNALASNSNLRIFATSQEKLSQCTMDDKSEGTVAFFQLVQAVNYITHTSVGPNAAPVLSEAFDPTNLPSTHLETSVRDYILGDNPKKVDFVQLFRLELELGNSAASFDVKRKQERLKKFMEDAQAVYTHLGLWCLLKYIQIELQTNLRPCLVDDPDNINVQRKRAKDDENESGEYKVEVDMESESDTGNTREAMMAWIDQWDDEEVKKRICPIVKAIKWLDKLLVQTTTMAATPRLRKAADIVVSRGKNDAYLTDSKDESVQSMRCWVLVLRRCHVHVLAEYFSACLQPLNLPPACGMQGNASARISGSLHGSSPLRIINMLWNGQTNVIVSTSMSKTSSKRRKAPPTCDLVLALDDMNEADKLLDCYSLADPDHGVVKCLIEDTKAAASRFIGVLQKLQALQQIEMEQSGQTSTATDSSTMSMDTVGAVVHQTTFRGVGAQVAATIASQKKMEMYYQDTGARLDVENSVQVLSAFCDTLPGLDTYDRRPQYVVKRHPMGSGMTESTKRSKKDRRAYNSTLDDKIDDLKVEALDDTDVKETSRFEFSATLIVPSVLKIKKQYGSAKVSSDKEAKGIVAFKACQALCKQGYLDRHFRSVLETDEQTPATGSTGEDTTVKDTTVVEDHLSDLSTQSSYDIPPVNASDLGLRPVRSLLQDDQLATAGSVTMHLYGLSDLRFAILSTDELYTGNTNTGWRYDFATSAVMSPELRPVTLQKAATSVTLTKDELQLALHFHLVLLRLACMRVEDAMRDVDIANDSIWNEFSNQNDKGYVVVPAIESTGGSGIDWEYLKDILSQPLLEPMWPQGDSQAFDKMDDWILVPTNRRNVTYIVQKVSDKSVKQLQETYLSDPAAWTTHLKKGKSTPGNPILGRWYTRDHLSEADSTQPLLHSVQVPTIVPLIRRVMQRNNQDGAIARSQHKFNERLLMPQYTSRLRMSRQRYFEAMGVVPLLYDFERKCQLSKLMSHIGVEVDLALLEDATTKPNYERLEILGDTFLKLETSWYMYQERTDLRQEGALTQLRRDIIRNDRLLQFAMKQGLHRCMLYPSAIEQKPFDHWKPSCMGRTPLPVVAPSKWIADVLEAVCGAYLVGVGETGARHFLHWTGVQVPSDNHMYAGSFYPFCYPNEILHEGNDVKSDALDFSISRFQDAPERLEALQRRLKYSFKNKRLLLEAVTHPSTGKVILSTASNQPETWKGDYERLEYLGDAIIEYLTLSYAYVSYEHWQPGALSLWKSATVSNDALGKTALACFGVDECMLSGALRIDPETLDVVSSIERKYDLVSFSSKLEYKQIHRKGKKAEDALGLPKIFGDVFEALVAAVFLDSGRDLHCVRDVFLGPLLETVGKEALAFVCRESGISMDPALEEEDEQDLMLLSDDE